MKARPVFKWPAGYARLPDDYAVMRVVDYMPYAARLTQKTNCAGYRLAFQHQWISGIHPSLRRVHQAALDSHACLIGHGLKGRRLPAPYRVTWDSVTYGGQLISPIFEEHCEAHAFAVWHAFYRRKK